MRSKGITLIEVLFASLILGVCIASLFSVWHYSIGTYKGTDERSAAANVARGAIEEVKVRGFLYYPTGTVVSSTSTPTSGKYSAPVVYYNSSWTVCDQASGVYRLQVSADDYDVASDDGSSTYQIMRLTKRTVTAAVTRISDNESLATFGTVLVRAGI